MLEGHGISIGSIATGKAVDTVTISSNTVTSSVNGLRIKTVYDATDASGMSLVKIRGCPSRLADEHLQ